MTHGTLRPSAINTLAGRLSCGAEEPRQHGRRTWIRARLPAVSPVVWLTSERVTQQALSLILFAVLAPILGPRPYGVFALVMVFVGFCEAILLAGAVEALVTVDDLDHLHTTTANLTNSLMALAFGLAMCASAPAIAAALHDAEIRNVLWALAPMPVLSTLSAAPIAVLRRSLKFKQLAIRSILGLTIGGVFGIVLAVAGAGVWALVLQVLAQRIAELAIGWIAVPVRFGVTWSAPHFHELRPVALNVFAARIMAMVNGQLPRLVLGFMLGPTDVGLFALGGRFHDIIVDTMAVPRTAVGRIELRAAKDRLCGIPARFRKDGAERIHPVVPFFPGNGGACAEPVSFMAQTTMAGRHCSCAAHRPRRRADGVILQFRRGAAGGRSLIRRPQDSDPPGRDGRGDGVVRRPVWADRRLSCAGGAAMAAAAVCFHDISARHQHSGPYRIAAVPARADWRHHHGWAHKFTLLASKLG